MEKTDPKELTNTIRRSINTIWESLRKKKLKKREFIKRNIAKSFPQIKK